MIKNLSKKDIEKMLDKIEKEQKKKKREKPLVKRPIGAYQFFISEIASNRPVDAPTFTLKEASLKWKELKDKSKYYEMKKKDEERYFRECEEKGIKKLKT